MTIEIGGKVEGIYSVQIRRNAGTENEYLEDAGESKNLLLDGFFTRWLSGSLTSTSWRFFVGTGSTAPIASETQLVAQLGPASGLASVTTNSNALVGSDYIASSTGVAQWNIGDIIGNIAEIGANIRNLSTGTALDSRALIVPSAITVTAGDQLVVSYTLKYKIPIAQHVSVVNFGGVSTTCTLETLNVLTSNIWTISQLIGATPLANSASVRISNTQALHNDVTTAPTVAASDNATFSYSSTGSARKNTINDTAAQLNGVGSIKYLVIASAAGSALYRQGILFDPPIAKDNTKTLTLDFLYTLARA